MKKFTLLFCLLMGFLFANAQINFEFISSLQKMKTASAVSKLESSGYHIREADDIDDSNYDYDSTS
jgi:hypothetical protein